MWRIKTFKTRQAMLDFIARRKIQYTEIFLNNKYGIEYRYLRSIYPQRKINRR